MNFMPQQRAIFATSQLQKVVREWCVFTSRYSGVQFFHIPASKSGPNMVCCKCASRCSGVQFFHILTSKSCPNMVFFVHFDLSENDIRTSKSGPNMLCFVHFDLQMCFAPEPRAIFPHQNFKKWSEHGVFCTF